MGSHGQVVEMNAAGRQAAVQSGFDIVDFESIMIRSVTCSPDLAPRRADLSREMVNGMCGITRTGADFRP